jgi:alkylation response protein AidB-like acyl-CoA dehydrogenase
MANRLVDLARDKRDQCDARLDDAVIDGWMRAEAFRQLGWWTETRIREGVDVGAESSIMKLHWSHLDIDLHETALEILGADAETEMENGAWMKTYLFALANPIWGGTSEIQRNIVAERILGLPRK